MDYFNPILGVQAYYRDFVTEAVAGCSMINGPGSHVTGLADAGGYKHPNLPSPSLSTAAAAAAAAATASRMMML